MTSISTVTITHTYEQLKSTVASLTSRIGDLERRWGARCRLGPDIDLQVVAPEEEDVFWGELP